MEPSGPFFSTYAPDQSKVYTPLKGPRCFRLLKFDEALFENRTPIGIGFILEQYNLDNYPSFVAISYVWGQPYRSLDFYEEQQETLNFDHKIWLNGETFAITANMWDALRTTLASTESEYIWLDGCCINQSDPLEREAQVLLMGSIFAGASEVVGFLGPLHPDLDSFYWLLWEFIPKISKLIVEGEKSIADGSLWTLRDRIATDKRYFEASLVGAHRFYHSCKWFWRAWVKQEVVLARNLRLICGRSQLPLDGLSLAGILFTKSGWSEELFIYKHQYLHPFLEKGALCHAFHDWRGFIEYRNDTTRATSFENEVLLPTWKADSREKLDYAWLLEFVLSMRVARCSDPRDKIFSVFGLAKKHCTGIGTDIKPDYRSSPALVYTYFMNSMVKHIGTLNFLAFVEPSAGRATVNLPSWVPDFGVAYPYNGHKTIALGNNLFSGAANDVSCFQNISCLADELQIHGICMDVVEAIQLEMGANRHSSLANLVSLLSLCKSCNQHYTNQSRTEVLWRTCIQDCYLWEGKQVPQRPAPSEVANSFYAYILMSFCEYLFVDEDKFETNLLSLQTILQDFASEVTQKQLPSIKMVLQGTVWLAQAGDHWVYDLRDPVQETGDECLDWVSWLRRATAAWESVMKHAQTTYSRCFRTKTGRLGSAGADVKVGDEIWFAPASSLPLALRPNSLSGGKHFKFISVLYLHGMMDGEAFRENPGLLEKVEPLALR